MEIIGYIASLFIGIILGLIGGGGSILTLPVLVYLFGVAPTLATAYSLFIVGAASLAGTYTKHREGLINYRTALTFGIPSISTVFITRKFILPAIPADVFSMQRFVVTKDLLLMLLFALLMVAASMSMLWKRTSPEIKHGHSQPFHYALILVAGAGEGLLTGLVGAGGGFLIIPALVTLNKLPMKQAVGTSLLIIAAKSWIGFSGDLLNGKTMDWELLLTISSIAIIGIFLGNVLSRKIDGASLKKGFGWFVLVMGTYILLKEIGFIPGGV